MNPKAKLVAVAATAAAAAAVYLALAPSAAPELRPGMAIERLAPRERPHRYRIPSESGQRLALRLEQRSADVSLRLRSPDGQQAWRLNAPTSGWGVEAAFWVAASGGDWTLEVAHIESGQEGYYRLTLASPPPEDDRARRRLHDALRRVRTCRNGWRARCA